MVFWSRFGHILQFGVQGSILAYRIRVICRVPKTPGKGYFAPDKVFAGCSTRQRTSGKKLTGKDFFAGCFLSGTRQRLCRGQIRHLANKSDRYGAGSMSH
jgi:hypothetical protein